MTAQSEAAGEPPETATQTAAVAATVERVTPPPAGAAAPGAYVIVSHTHWDREWHHTFEQFRARLVDVIDALLELLAGDPEARFLLDGQAVMLEDYLELRPARQAALRGAIARGQLIVGPWYVQADGLMPSGEAIVRNLLAGRRVAEALGGCSRIGYVPDSFGHTAALPQILRGFGIESFVFWRGIDDRTARLPSDFRWQAADGSTVLAVNLLLGYSAAGNLDPDPLRSAGRLERLGRRLRVRSAGDGVLIMHGHDHAPPEAHVREVAAALAARTGAAVMRGGIEAYVERLRPLAERLPIYRGELRGARYAPILAGVYSTRVYLKLLNARAQHGLERAAEPWAALAWLLGAADERPALQQAWRALLRNQPHDSLPGCSIDAVHQEMLGRYLTAIQLAEETAARGQDFLSGLPLVRTAAPDAGGAFPIAVFNPGLAPRDGAVLLHVDPYPAFRVARDAIERGSGDAIHPLLRLLASGEPLELTDDHGAALPFDRLPHGETGHEAAVHGPSQTLRWTVRAVPPLGWQRYHLRARQRPARGGGQGQPFVDRIDTISNQHLAAGLMEPGGIWLEDRELGLRFEGLLQWEDEGERGDSYLHWALPDGTPILSGPPHAYERRRYPSGIQTLAGRYRMEVPAALAADGLHRSPDLVELDLLLELTLVPGVARLDVRVQVENRARDHRLRLRLPFGLPLRSALAGVAFGAQEQFAAHPRGRGWAHEPPSTFPQHDYVALTSGSRGLAVVAPGLHEAELRPDGVLLLTLLRSIGYLAGAGVAGINPIAGPHIPVPEAQMLGPLEARLALLPFAGRQELATIPGYAWEAAMPLSTRPTGIVPRLAPERSLLCLRRGDVLLSALKPAEDGTGIVVRLFNPRPEPQEVELECSLPFTAARRVQLDELPQAAGELEQDGSRLRLTIAPQGTASILLER